MDEKILFFSTFLKYPKEIGSIIPSSKFLSDEMLKNIDFKDAKYIVEYGPGTGSITLQILRRARKDAKIFCLETNKKFCSYLKKNIKDERLIIINDNVENIKDYLKKFNIPKIDCIISGLPFSILTEDKKRTIIKVTENTLKKNGRFVMFKYVNNFKDYLYNYFSIVSVKFVPFNIPPCFVYVCEK